MSAATGPPNGTSRSSALDTSNFPQTLETPDIRVSLTFASLPVQDVLSFTRSPHAGANILFLGTTRNNFDNRPVSKLSYSAYPALALKSFKHIAELVKEKYGLEKVCLVHRLGDVGIEEESIAVCVSAGHRGPAWRGAEEALELCKKILEVWKMEWFEDEQDGKCESGVWRANKERDKDGRLLGDLDSDAVNTTNGMEDK